MAPEVFLAFVEQHRQTYTITFLCHIFGVPRATYYRWCRKSWEPSGLDQLIIDLCRSLQFRVGHRTIRGLLGKDHGIHVHRCTVQRIMQKYGLQCQIKPKRARKPAGLSDMVVPNRLDQQFQAQQPNEKWVTDITYLPYGPTMWYLSTVMDLYNNEVLAYTIRDRQDTALVLDTLERACASRETSGTILHSDQGCQYTSYAFQEAAHKKGIITSMSRRGNCFDNAVIESFHSSLKSEGFRTPRGVPLTSTIILENVQTYMYYYNYQRPFTKLAFHTPVEYRTAEG